jgi:hypothetical protein
MDVQRSCLVAAFMISYTLERAAAAAELAPREPGPEETNLIFVSREPGQLRALASREHGPGDGAGIQTIRSCITGAWLIQKRATKQAIRGRLVACIRCVQARLVRAPTDSLAGRGCQPGCLHAKAPVGLGSPMHKNSSFLES